jgi:hypothetical protein
VGAGSLLNEIGVAANMTSDGCAQITLHLYYECSQCIGDHFRQRRQKTAKSYYPLSPSDPSYHEEVSFVGRHSSKYRGRKHNRIIVFYLPSFSIFSGFFYSISLPPFHLTILPPQYPDWQILHSGCGRTRPMHDMDRQHTTTVRYWKWCRCKFLGLEGYCC